MVNLPEKFRSSQPMKMPSRALPSTTTPRQLPLVKSKSKQANVGTPKLGGELPPVKPVPVNPVRKRPPMPRTVQVVSNMAAPYGSKGGMTPLRNPMLGSVNPRRPTR